MKTEADNKNECKKIKIKINAETEELEIEK